jgi:hypothetical protein
MKRAGWSMLDSVRDKVLKYVKDNFDAAMHKLRVEQEEKRKTVAADLGARGFGYAIRQSDPRYDDVEVWHCEAVLRAKADALFRAYEVYGLKPDDFILNELRSHQQQQLASRRSSLIHQAVSAANRTGRNPAPDVAHAESLGRKIERTTHALLKVFACELEERKNMPKADPVKHVAFTQNVYGSPTNVAQGESVTVVNAPVTTTIYASIQASIESSVSSEHEKIALLGALESLKQTKDKPTFLERSKQFLQLVSSCTQLAPHVAHWTHQITELARLHGYLN